MASAEQAEALSLLAGSDFSAALHLLVEVTADNTVDVINATTDTPVGVVGEQVPIGVVCPVVMLKGRIKMRAGAAIAAGQILVPAADGRVTGVADIAAIPADTMGVGVALSTAAAADDVIEAAGMQITTAGLT